MPRVRFLGVTRDEWRHRTGGGTVYAHHARGEDGLTTRIRNPCVVEPGEEFDATDWEAQWLEAHYPHDFKILGDDE